jgi:hypothetical protein
MAEAGQVIQGQAGFSLRLVTTAAETDGELLEMEATYGGTGAMPPGHPDLLDEFSDEVRLTDQASQ